MKMYVIKKAQRGFAMLEVLLAVIVIAMVSFGVYSLYNSSSESSQAASFQQVANQVMSGAARYGATTYTVAPDAAALIKGNYIPAKISDGADTINGPYGTITYTAGTAGPQSFTISSANVPASQGMSICNALGGSYGIGNGNTTDISGDCNQTYSDPFTIYIISPKPK